MFNCRKHTMSNSRFVDDDVRMLVELEKYKQNHSVSTASVDEDSPLHLFGYELFYLDDKLLQNMVIHARDNIEKLSVEAFRNDLGHFECQKQIAELNLFLRLILGQVCHLSEKDLLESISKLYDVLPELVSVVEGTEILSANEMDKIAFDFFHVLLDFHWYGLIIASVLQQRGMSSDKCTSMLQSALENLVQLALFKFSKIEKNRLPTDNQFYCTCVRNIWIGIIGMCTTESNQLDFWTLLSKVLDVNRLERHEKRRLLEQRAPAGDFLFITWFINGIVSLSQYCTINPETFKESPLVNIPYNYSILDRAIKEVIQGDKPEEHLRIFLLLLKPIYSKWWPVKHDFLILLWEYFSKRLNSPFQLPSESLSKLACLSRTAIGLIEQARNQASQQAFDTLDSQTSSYKCYLAMIAFMLRYYSDNNQKTKVQIIFNRTVLKFTPAKLELLTEQGVYNFSLLMLTMLESTPYVDDYHRLSKQMLHLKLVQTTASSSNLDITIRRITTICLANAALVLEFSQRAFDKSVHLQHLLDGLDEAWMKYGNRIQPAFHVLADVMGSVYDAAIASGRQLDQGDQKFVGSWLGKYLSGCSEGERDALFQKINRLFGFFRSRLPFRIEDHNSMLQPLFEIVLPFVKESFGKNEKSYPVITELAANFTLFCTGQPFAEPFLALFSNFADNTNVNPGLRLSYTKLVINSDRMDEVEDKLVIRCWLKFAILASSEQLRELSQVVVRMREFQSLCEIPAHDLCEEGEEPIGLFFKFVGKKFKEFEGKDCRMQYEMTIKMLKLFQNFDKWLPSSPNIALLKRVISILALALKECGAVIYIRNNPTCLYHVAFNHYFLPIAVLTDRNVPNDLILAMGKMWFRIMDSMGQMNYTGDPVISDHVTNMMIKWAPQFAKFKDLNDIARPFVTFISSSNEPFISFVFSRYLSSYVELQMSTPKTNAEIGLKLLLYTVGVLHNLQDNGKIAFFIRLTATAILEHATMCHEMYPSKAVATEIVFKMLECTRGNSNLIKMELKNSLALYTKRHLTAETGQYFRFMSKLADKNPELIKSMITTIRAELADTERLMGSEEDKHLRRMMLQLEGVVEANFNKQRA